MEPTIEYLDGRWPLSSGAASHGEDQNRDATSRTIDVAWEHPGKQDEWRGIRQYNGYHTCSIVNENMAYAVQLAEELHSLGTLKSVPFDWSHCLKTMRMVSTNPMFFCRLAHNGLYCGAVVGHVDYFFFAPKLLASENAWFVREGTPFRAKIAMTLMREFIEWAMIEKGADHVQCGDIANINTMAVDALYRRLGFKRYGAIYRYGGM